MGAASLTPGNGLRPLEEHLCLKRSAKRDRGVKREKGGGAEVGKMKKTREGNIFLKSGLCVSIKAIMEMIF